MTSIKVFQGIISLIVSFVFNQPIVSAVSKTYFGYSVPVLAHTAITVITFAVISLCLYLFFQDLYSILCHKNGGTKASSHT